MHNYLRLLCRLFLLFLPVLIPSGANAQDFTGERASMKGPAALNQVLTSWDIYRLDPMEIKQFIHDQDNNAAITLHIGSHNWTLELQPNHILSPNYTLQVLTENGVEIIHRTDQRAFKGWEQHSGGRVRLTLDKDFIQGFIEDGKERYYIEPLWYHQRDAERDLFLVYPVSAVIHDQDATCIELASSEELDHSPGNDKLDDSSSPELLNCYELEIAIASDHLMYNKYGSVSGVENHNIAVINDVQGDYTGNFNNDLEFNIVTQYVSTGTDPWTNSTDAGTLLDSFRNWGQNGGFGVSYDNAELWTDRDFNGSTVGIAYLNGICTSLKYHCLQDWTSNSELLRCMTSHEIGHNFNAGHDTGGGVCPPNYIMCPFVSTSSTWSSTSLTTINSYMQGKINNGCLGPCSSGPPLVADFTWSPDPPCQAAPVQFNDMSTGPITGRQWTFAGGTPPTSTATNPVVTWNTSGPHNVTLTVTGGGNSVSTTKTVDIQPLPSANFTQSFIGLTYSFNNLSQNATSYEWAFGDGDFSTDQNPTHTYVQSGFYNVVLTVFNDCGSSTKNVLINTIPTADFSADPTSGCATLTVSFTNLSSQNSNTYVWQFPGGLPSSSNAQDPIVQYPNSGIYSVTLTAFNQTGSDAEVKTGYITVQSIPSASFSYSKTNNTVTFTNNSGGATSYLWDFGDGYTSTETNPVHTYDVGGSYMVTLTSTNACGNTTATQTITLLAPPNASFTATPTSGCDSLNVQFTSTTTGNPASLQWSFPGGTPNTATTSNPQVAYHTPGTYTVTLIAGNAAGNDTLVQTNYITVRTIPTAGFTSLVNLDTVAFTNTSSGATSYSWAFGDGQTSTQANPTHIYAADGTYTVTLTSTNVCGTTTVSHTVTIITPPTAGFTATPTSGCGPLSVQFTSTSSANSVTYSWSFPGGTPATSSAQNPTVIYNTAGVYSVTLTVSNPAGSNTATQTNYIMVNPDPTAGFMSATNGFVATFTNTSLNSASYSWTFGDGGTSTVQNPAHTYSNDGTYTVTLISSNPCGSDTISHTVVIVTPPTAGFTASPTAGCGPLTVQFTSTSSANAVNYNWSFPGGSPATSTAQNPVVVYNTAGTYSVTLIVSNPAGNDTLTQVNYITVNPGPTAGFTSSVNGSTATFTNTSTNSTSYSWDFGDGGSSTQQNPAHNYTSDGTYTVTLTATNACGTNTFTQSVTIATPPTAGFTASPTNGCGPLTVQFTNTSSDNATNFNWAFPGGTPSSSTAENPSVTYNAPGTYTVTLTVSNSVGTNTATQTNYITVNPGPTAGFTSSTDSLTAAFSNSSLNATSYSWNFGDGNTSTNANPTHTYDTDGTYTVVLTATNACGTSTFTQNVVIITTPDAGFTANVTTGCGPLTVQFEDLSSENTTGWAWSFPGGTPDTSNEQNPVVVYTTPGTYDVTLVASTAAGSSTFTQSAFITVLPLPTPGFSVSVTGPTAMFTNNSQNATSYLWDFGDGSTSSQANPTHTYMADSTYTVVLTATNNCGSTTTTQTVTAVTLPQAAFTPSVAEGCAPLDVQFTNQSSANATSFDWTFEGGTPATSTDANPTVTWDQPGVYTVTLTATNSAGSATTTSSITVNGPPSAGFTAQTAGLAVILTNTSVNATSYSWDFGDGETSTEANPTHTFGSTGTFTVTLVAENACGTATFNTAVEIAGTAPIATFAANELKGCVPFAVQFTDKSAGDPTAWEWSFPGGNPATSTDQHPTVTYDAIGTYSVTLVATNAYGSNTSTQTNYIQVIDVPSAGFTYVADQTTVTFTNTSQNADSYSWNFGDGNTSTEADPTHIFPSPGTYTVELTVTNACGASTLQQMLVLISATGELSWLEQFRLFPNPNGGTFTVEMIGDARDEIDFFLYNAIGQLEHRESFNFGIGALTHKFNFTHLPAGMYTLQIRSGAQAMQVKIIIQQ